MQDTVSYLRVETATRTRRSDADANPPRLEFKLVSRNGDEEKTFGLAPK
jgi:hypothetical protein